MGVIVFPITIFIGSILGGQLHLHFGHRRVRGHNTSVTHGNKSLGSEFMREKGYKRLRVINDKYPIGAFAIKGDKVYRITKIHKNKTSGTHYRITNGDVSGNIPIDKIKITDKRIKVTYDMLTLAERKKLLSFGPSITENINNGITITRRLDKVSIYNKGDFKEYDRTTENPKWINEYFAFVDSFLKDINGN